MKYLATAKASNGITFTARRLDTGSTYGLYNSFTAERTMIEFYDTRHKGNYGQFIARYYAKTLRNSAARGGGINLHGGMPGWQIDGPTFTMLLAQL